MLSSEERRRALHAAYGEHADAVFRTCLKLAAGDRGWALDRTHDTFMKLDDSLERLDLNDLGPWLRKVAVRECLMDLRKRERRSGLLGRFRSALTPERPPATPERALQHKRDLAALEAALGTLPASQRVLLGLMYFEGMTLTEAAGAVGVSKGQASKLHARALASLGTRTWEAPE